MDPLIGTLVAVGATAVVPLGLHRLGTPGVRPVARWWPAAGLLATGGLLLPRGAGAVLAVLPYALACALVTALGLARALRWLRGARPDPVAEVVALTAAGSLSVAGLSLVWERAGVPLLGFDLEVLALTVAHFHFAGFAAVLLAGLTAQAAPCRAAVTGALAVPAGTAVVGAGWFLGEAVELAGALLLAAGLVATSWVVLRRLAPTVRDRGGRRLLQVAAWVTPLTMALAVSYALGEATGLPHLSVSQTAVTHGVANALGVGLAGMLGWARTRPAPL